MVLLVVSFKRGQRRAFVDLTVWASLNAKQSKIRDLGLFICELVRRRKQYAVRGERGKLKLNGMDDLLTLLNYHAWATARVLEALEPLSAEEMERDLHSSHGGVKGTLAHTYSADLIWTARLKGESSPPFLEPAELPARSELLPLWLAHLDERRADVAPMRPDQLFSYPNLKGEAQTNRVGDILRHVVNHATHHRGQLVTMLRQLGHAAPNTDLIRFYRER